MRTKRQEQTSEERAQAESGLPGGGKGRKDEVSGSGVYPMSGPLPDNPAAQTHGMASWGQGRRGAEGYEDHGESEITNFEKRVKRDEDESARSGDSAEIVSREPAAEANRTDNTLRLEELIADFRIAMLTTMTGDGHLHSRPMLARPESFDGDLWFFTHAHTHKAEEVRCHQQVNVSYADPDKERYVSISGKASLVQDRQKMEELWDPVYEDWFPEALADRDLVLLRVSVESAEYWDSRGCVMARLTPEPQFFRL